MKQRQLHSNGLVMNFGPKAARTKRELPRLMANVRKVLYRKPGTLVLWVERNRLLARAYGRGFFSTERLVYPYAGRVISIGTRALLVLRGKVPGPPTEPQEPRS